MLSGAGKKKTRKARASLGAPPATGECKCVFNTRTGRGVPLCFVGKGPKNRSGWQFTKGSCSR